jgi:hypothetical protein
VAESFQVDAFGSAQWQAANSNSKALDHSHLARG